MHHLLNLFLEILRLRKGPQALPTSELLLAIVLALHFLLGVTILAVTLPIGQALLGGAVGTGMLVAVVKAMLALRNLSHRFLQTATALGGSEFLLTLPLLPFELWQHGSGVTAILSLLLTGWGVVVAAHVFRHALELPHWRGFAVAVGYFFVSMAVAGLVLGPGV